MNVAAIPPGDSHIRMLARCRPTEEIELEVKQARAAVERAQQPCTDAGIEFVDVTRIRQAEGRLTDLIAERDLCRERDQLRANRPENCRCFGLGIDPSTGNPCKFCDEGRHARAAIERFEADARNERMRRRIERFREAAPARIRHMTLNTYPATTTEQRRLLERLREWANADECTWVFLTGPVGVGKTALAKAAAEARLESGDVLVPVVFATAGDFLARIRRTFDRDADEETGDVIEEYSNAALLILDDLGAEKGTPWAVEQLFLLINHRYDEMLPTIVTSNLGVDELVQHLSDAAGHPDAGKRVVWRVIESAKQYVFDLVGFPNLRQRPHVVAPQAEIAS